MQQQGPGAGFRLYVMERFPEGLEEEVAVIARLADAYDTRPAPDLSAMPRLHCDFNSSRQEGGLLASMDGHPDLRRHLQVGDSVLLDDGEGNTVVGFVCQINAGPDQNYATCDVVPDWSTWVNDGAVS